jgi:protein-serine/threonine kinase
MLSDFDLAKQSTEPGGLPVMVHSDANGVNKTFPSVLWTCISFRLLDNLNVSQVPLVDTMSCTAHFRTNSFVGTEGEQ